MKLQTTVSEEVGLLVRELAAEDGRSVSAWLAVMVKDAVRGPDKNLGGGKGGIPADRAGKSAAVARSMVSGVRASPAVAGEIPVPPANPKLEGVDEVCPIGVNPRAIAAEREKQKKLAEQGKGEA